MTTSMALQFFSPQTIMIMRMITTMMLADVDGACHAVDLDCGASCLLEISHLQFYHIIDAKCLI